MILLKLTDDNVEWKCSCGKKNETPVKDVRVGGIQITIGKCSCGRGSGALLNGDIRETVKSLGENAPQGVIKRSIMCQTLGARAIASKQFMDEKSIPVKNGCCSMAEKWKKGKVMEMGTGE